MLLRSDDKDGQRPGGAEGPCGCGMAPGRLARGGALSGNRPIDTSVTDEVSRKVWHLITPEFSVEGDRYYVRFSSHIQQSTALLASLLRLSRPGDGVAHVVPGSTSAPGLPRPFSHTPSVLRADGVAVTTFSRCCASLPAFCALNSAHTAKHGLARMFASVVSADSFVVFGSSASCLALLGLPITSTCAYLPHIRLSSG
jgi:hypothetical protein